MSENLNENESSPNISDAREVAAEIREAGKIANRNIERFLKLQAEERANLIMVAHQQELLNSAKAAAAASELANVNIKRFLNLKQSNESLGSQAENIQRPDE